MEIGQIDKVMNVTTLDELSTPTEVEQEQPVATEEQEETVEETVDA